MAGESFPVRAVDASDAEAVAAAGGNFDLIVLSVSSGGGDAAAYARTYLGSTRSLLRRFPDARLVFTSSTSVYAQSDGSIVTEESLAKPARETGKILREAETLVLQAGGTVARLAGIYGPGRSAFLKKLRAGEATIDGDGSRYLNQIHRDDAAAALFLLATSEAARGGIFNVADDEPIAQRDAYRWLTTQLHLPLPPVAASDRPRKRGDSNKRVANAKLRALGWAPSYPTMRDGMERSVFPSFGLTTS